jgi:hypothetical protein
MSAGKVTAIVFFARGRSLHKTKGALAHGTKGASSVMPHTGT